MIVGRINGKLLLVRKSWKVVYTEKRANASLHRCGIFARESFSHLALQFGGQRFGSFEDWVKFGQLRKIVQFWGFGRICTMKYFYWGGRVPSPFFPIRDLWMWGMTPPPAIVALINVSNSSSPRIASWRCLGVILFTFRSLDALPANSSTSAVRYSRMAEL